MSDSAFNTSLRRIFDAASNRAAEGLRVIEDYVRFALDDRSLTESVKRIRHGLTAVLDCIPTADRLAARESLADVGASTKAEREFERADMLAVVAASFQRTQQAIRSLEEYAKLINATVAQQLERLRYECYQLEHAIAATSTGIERLANSQLYVLVDGQKSEVEFRELIVTLVTAGVHVLQLRDKSLDDRTLLARAVAMRELTRGSQTLFIMNDRPDLAVLADADGVHVGQEELPVSAVRKIVGTKMLVGVSTHSIEQAKQAVLDGANYLGVGPTFPSKTKHFGKFPGLDFVREVSESLSIPAFAIGGITLENLADVQAAGGIRVAVGAAITAAENVDTAVAEFLKQFATHSASNSVTNRSKSASSPG